MFLNRKIDAFDYDEETGAISNRRTAFKFDPSLGVSLLLKCRLKCYQWKLERFKVTLLANVSKSAKGSAG